MRPVWSDYLVLCWSNDTILAKHSNVRVYLWKGFGSEGTIFQEHYLSSPTGTDNEDIKNVAKELRKCLILFHGLNCHQEHPKSHWFKSRGSGFLDKALIGYNDTSTGLMNVSRGNGRWAHDLDPKETFVAR